MLSFKKGKYTLEDLQILHSVLVECLKNIQCSGNCRMCKSSKVCRDIESCREYVDHLIREKIEKNFLTSY